MVQKVFVCSDVHDDVDALRKFADYAQAQQADHLLVLGDLSLRPYTRESLEKLLREGMLSVPAFIREKRAHNAQVLGEMAAVLKASGIPFRVIPGNYDSTLDDLFPENDIHKKTTRLGEATMFGYGGADAFPGHIELLVRIGEIVPFDHNELYASLKEVNPAIGMIHNPPEGLCDDMYNGQNVGTPATTRFILENAPKLILSGHIHEAGPSGNNPNGVKGVTKVVHAATKSSTVVVNPGNLGRFELINMPRLDTFRSFDYGTFTELLLEADGTPTRLVQYTVQAPERKVGTIRKIGEYAIA